MIISRLRVLLCKMDSDIINEIVPFLYIIINLVQLPKTLWQTLVKYKHEHIKFTFYAEKNANELTSN